MWRLASETVDTNSPYSYLMLGEYFAENCAVAERDGELVGFVTGFRPFEDPETLFIWQIAVSESVRGHGVASRLLDHVVERPRVPRLRYLEATVTPGNDASKRLFRAFAERWRTECLEEELFARGDFPRDGDDPHDAEFRFRIGAF
jgi:L-2,4-diaminobutyric acid acetyltransferase